MHFFNSVKLNVTLFLKNNDDGDDDENDNENDDDVADNDNIRLKR